MAHAVLAILEDGHAAEETKQQFVQATMKHPGIHRDRFQILGFARQLHDHHIAIMISKKNLDTLRTAFKVTGKIV